MTAFQEHWVRIAARFGLKVEIPFQVDLPGERLTVPVLLQEFGAERGMLLVTSYEDIASVTEQLVSAGFGYSCLSDSPGTDLDESQIVDMLRDWGWMGSGEAPSWYVSSSYSAWDEAVSIGKDGTSALQVRLAETIARILGERGIPPAAQQRKGQNEPIIHLAIPQLAAVTWLYVDGAEVDTAGKDVRFERWDFPSPDALISKVAELLRLLPMADTNGTV